MRIVLLVFVLCVTFCASWSHSQPHRPSLFIVPRVDGVVSAFDAASGKLLWNFSTGGPLVQSSSPTPSPSASDTPPPPPSPFVSQAEMSIFNVIQRDGLQELYPETNSILSATPFMSPDGTIFLSHKNSKVFRLDPLTGNIIPDNILCSKDSTTLLLEEQDPPPCISILQIVRTEHTLESHNITGTRFLTVSHIRAFLHECQEQDEGVKIDTSLIPSLSTTHLGDLQALDKKGKPLWVFDLPASHSQLVYVLTPHSLRAIRPQLRAEPLHKVPLSLTHYKGTPYESSFAAPETQRTLALPPPDSRVEDTKRSIWYWIATICICTTATIWGLIILKYQSRNAQTQPLTQTNHTPLHTPPPKPTMPLVPRSNSILRLREEHEQLQQRLKDLLLQQEQQQERHLLQAQQLQQLQEQQIQLQRDQQRSHHNHNHNQGRQSPEMPLAVSRYRVDFEEKARLGEGGFGTVFLAINKLDGVEYAVKKVLLTPGNSKENARVLREVRYLALLDHPNIIRYFQSWVEEDVWDEWDECRIGLRIEDSDEDEDMDDETGDEDDGVEPKRERKQSYEGDEGETKMIEFKNSVDDHQYEGDESCVQDTTSGAGSSLVSFSHNASGIGSPSISRTMRMEDLSTSDGGKEERIKLAKKRLKKALNRRRSQSFDGTCERSYGSTSDPVSIDNGRRGGLSEVRTRKPILYIQMQYCHQGTLHNWLSRSDRVVCPNEVVAIFRQAVRGVVHIHSHFVIHRDLKPPNILISADGSVKIGDFGLSTGGNVDNGPQSPTRNLSLSHTTGVGSPLYCSPEQLKGERYDSKVDIFSLGVILYEMFHIFSTQMERVSHITQLREGYIGDQTKEQYPELVDLALRLVQTNPTLRPQAQEILTHSLLASCPP